MTRERSHSSKGLFWRWRKEELSLLGVAQKWKGPRDSGVSRGHGAGFLCCTSDRGTGILFLATGHRGSPALKAKSAVLGRLPWRKTTNELNSVDPPHRWPSTPHLVSARVESPIVRGNLSANQLLAAKGRAAWCRIKWESGHFVVFLWCPRLMSIT